jgi:hypothetical protein
VDTAGRLHTQEGLMDELRKVVRVVGRRLPGAPHETLLVLDGTVGQNAIQQGRLFAQAVSPTGIIVTKLDGSARGGAVTALRRELGLPIRSSAPARRRTIQSSIPAIRRGVGRRFRTVRYSRTVAYPPAARPRMLYLDTPVKFSRVSANAAPSAGAAGIGLRGPPWHLLIAITTPPP